MSAIRDIDDLLSASKFLRDVVVECRRLVLQVQPPLQPRDAAIGLAESLQEAVDYADSVIQKVEAA